LKIQWLVESVPAFVVSPIQLMGMCVFVLKDLFLILQS